MLISNILCKKLTKDLDAVVITGYSHFAGGVLLVIIGICSGGNIGYLSVKSAGIFAYICAASIVAYCLWNSILKNNNLSHLFIIKFTEPLFACIFSAILLGEDIFKWQNIIAVLLVSLGIILGSFQRKRKVLSEQKDESCDGDERG
ncbi:MAG: DMT family transporter [Clostridia bacterium]|nr:DMT family transporter [Clostridia bacterium]